MANKWLPYSLYLACSWLWCIGAFLPLIILRDFGVGALVAFAFFNVVGAAGFGFYFNRQRQKYFLRQHRPMLNVFSGVTTIFQIFFVVWFCLLVSMQWLLPVMLLLAMVFYVSSRYITGLAMVLYLISLILLAIFSDAVTVSIPTQFKPGWGHIVLPLALGFIFSPYLDLTFHRAFSQTRRPGLVFAMGFGVFFFSLLGFVFVYSAELNKVFFEGHVTKQVLYPVVAFIVLQTAFTVAVHAREYQRFNGIHNQLVWVFIAIISVLIWAAMATTYDVAVPILANANVGEILYKSLLFFYGLVFPLYLLLHDKRQYLTVALLLSTPFYAIGFLVGGEYLYTLSIAMAIVLVTVCLSRLVKPTGYQQDAIR